MVGESIAPPASRVNRAPVWACNHARTMEAPPSQPPRSSPIAEDEARRIPPLLAGYWSFGQYWGTWVIVVVELNRHRGLSYGRNGLLLALLSIVAVLVMTFGAPRLTRFPTNGLVAGSLTTLGVGALAMAVLPTGTLWIAFVLVGAGNGLIDVFLNIEAQRVEVVTGRPVLQWLHASYAAGGVTGAAVGGAIVAAGAGYPAPLAIARLLPFLPAAGDGRRGARAKGPARGPSAVSLAA